MKDLFNLDDTELEFRDMAWRDLEEARQQRNHPHTRKWLGQRKKIGFFQQVKWFWKLKRDPTKARLIITLNKERIGIVRIDDKDEANLSICIGMDIDPDYRGKGYSQQAYHLLINKLFSEGWNRIWLLVGAYNNRAIHIYEKVGFQHEGTHREALWREEDNRFYDCFLMGILKREYNVDTAI